MLKRSQGEGKGGEGRNIGHAPSSGMKPVPFSIYHIFK
jgi:hypothetical protein